MEIVYFCKTYKSNYGRHRHKRNIQVHTVYEFTLNTRTRERSLFCVVIFLLSGNKTSNLEWHVEAFL